MPSHVSPRTVDDEWTFTLTAFYLRRRVIVRNLTRDKSEFTGDDTPDADKIFITKSL